MKEIVDQISDMIEVCHDTGNAELMYEIEDRISGTSQITEAERVLLLFQLHNGPDSRDDIWTSVQNAAMHDDTL